MNHTFLVWLGANFLSLSGGILQVPRYLIKNWRFSVFAGRKMSSIKNSSIMNVDISLASISCLARMKISQKENKISDQSFTAKPNYKLQQTPISIVKLPSESNQRLNIERLPDRVRCVHHLATYRTIFVLCIISINSRVVKCLLQHNYT